MTRTTERLAVLVMVVAGLACLAPIGTARAATHEVAITDFAFTPQTLTIAVGDTVTWTNTDPVSHTATSVNGAFDSGDIGTGESYSLTFNSAGTYEYLCTPHPTMTGTIVVVAPTPSGELPNVATTPPQGGPGPTQLVGAALLGLAAAALVMQRGRTARRT